MDSYHDGRFCICPGFCAVFSAVVRPAVEIRAVLTNADPAVLGEFQHRQEQRHPCGTFPDIGVKRTQVHVFVMIDLPHDVDHLGHDRDHRACYHTLQAVPCLVLRGKALFLVVFFVVAKMGFSTIVKAVDERKRYVDESLEKAHKASERLENIKQEGEGILREARIRQAELLKEAAATRDQILQDAREKARKESERMINEAKAEIENEKVAAISSIRKQVALLSVGIAEKVLRNNLTDDKAQMILIDRMLDEVSVSDNKNFQ